MKTILVALDLEGDADPALARAVQLAADHAAWLVLLHVIETEPLSYAASTQGKRDLRAALRRQAVVRMEEYLVKFGRTRRTDVRVEFGSPHSVITQLAAERSADLVVLGSGKKHARTLREKVLGSTADRVVRTSPAPILLVRYDTPEPYRHIIVAVDFSPQSVSAAQAAHRLAPHARLHLVHAVDVPLPFEQALLRAGTPQAEIDGFRLARAAKAREGLFAFARDVVGIKGAATKILEGEPGPALVHLAKNKRIDLLALGPHGRGVVLQGLLGSVTQTVLREAACDILVAGAQK